MLKNIPPILGPDLLGILRAMGHGDEIAIVDANYPADAAGPALVRLDGISATDVLDAVLTLMPLDDFVEAAAFCMQVVGQADRREPVMDQFEAIIRHHEPRMGLASLERFAFYDQARRAFAVVQVGDPRPYGCFLLRKGVIADEPG